jgi:hypothetical protein
MKPAVPHQPISTMGAILGEIRYLGQEQAILVSVVSVLECDLLCSMCKAAFSVRIGRNRRKPPRQLGSTYRGSDDIQLAKVVF